MVLATGAAIRYRDIHRSGSLLGAGLVGSGLLAAVLEKNPFLPWLRGELGLGMLSSKAAQYS
jgi:hypothetical protein